MTIMVESMVFRLAGVALEQWLRVYTLRYNHETESGVLGMT